MKLDKIITLTGADDWNRLRFIAMERSLRAVGCTLPVRVIPFDDNRFPLPANSTWWEDKELTGWLAEKKASNKLRKYQTLLVANYHFVDTDIVFLKNPEPVLAPYHGFITSDGHWNNPQGNTYTEQSLKMFKAKTTTWQKSVFNSGQYACDEALYSLRELQHTCERPEFAPTCLYYRLRDQFAMNMLVNTTDVRVTNLTLPPLCMESTWAGDYDDDQYEQYWQEEDRKPYIIHWAGIAMNKYRPINKLFYDFLTAKEKSEWDTLVLARYLPKRAHRKYGIFQPVAVRLKKAYEGLVWGR